MKMYTWSDFAQLQRLIPWLRQRLGLTEALSYREV